MAKEQPGRRGGRARSGRLEFTGLEAGEKAPSIEIHALDRSGETLDSAKVDGKGGFSLARKAIDAAHRIVLGPPEQDPRGLPTEQALTYWGKDFRSMLTVGDPIEVDKGDWTRFRPVRICASGSVRYCDPSREPVLERLLGSLRAWTRYRPGAAEVLNRRERVRLSDAILAVPATQWHLPERTCGTICEGTVSVYRRTCCCWELNSSLDPVPDRGRASRGELDPEGPLPPPEERTLNPSPEIVDVEPSQHSTGPETPGKQFCFCGDPKFLGATGIRPDGTFRVCWSSSLFLPQQGCRYEYAFVVKQSFGDETTVIYDGRELDQWFADPDGVELVSHHPGARICGEGIPGNRGFIALQLIGTTASHRLKTPDAKGWDRVNAPHEYNDGLLNPASHRDEAIGRLLDQNLGGTLRLRYDFDAARDVGVAYYRISVTRADDNGNPVGGTRQLHGPLSWRYAPTLDEPAGSVGLGPHTVGGHSNLYRVPDDDHDWIDRHHGILDTTELPNGRHLLTLEVFDRDGKRLRPRGTPDFPAEVGGAVQADFAFGRWCDPAQPLTEVPYAALTHMFWCDNRPVKASIEYFVGADGVPSDADCQFLSGPGSAVFKAGYRAYHLDPLFHLEHKLWWRRGLSDSVGTLVRSAANAGRPPAAAAETGPVAADGTAPTYADMLAGNAKCSFALNLWVHAKTTNGEGRLLMRDDSDQAAFALENTNAP